MSLFSLFTAYFEGIKAENDEDFNGRLNLYFGPLRYILISISLSLPISL